jgi:tRNA U34 2-thiouridine synthase MnmA/TrmU
LTVQLRYRSAAASVATVEPGAAGELLVRLAAPFAAPAPGQTAVFYRGGVVVGAGVIDGRSWGARGARSAERRGEYDSVS